MQENGKANIGIKILCFFIPIVGLIFYLAYQNENKIYAKQCGKSALIGVIVAVAMPIIMLLGSLFVYIISASGSISDDVSAQFENMENQQNTSTINSNTNNNTNNATQVSNNKTSTYKVNYKGFKLYIPDDLVYDIDSTGECIAVLDEDGTWVAKLIIVERPYQQFKQKKSSLNTNISSALSKPGIIDVNVKPATIETIEDVEFIVMEVDYNGISELISLASLNSMYSLEIDIFNEDNDFNREYLKKLTSIVKTAEYTGTSSYIKTNENIKTEDIITAIKKAVEEE